jgi:hypothetical protein
MAGTDTSTCSGKVTLLVEHKSRGKDLDRAPGQAFDYFQGQLCPNVYLKAGLPETVADLWTMSELL